MSPDEGLRQASARLGAAVEKRIDKGPPKPAVKPAQPTRREVLKFFRASRRKSFKHEAHK